MKTNSKITMLTLILSLLILAQSCTVYKSANVTLDQAVKHEDKTKIVTTKGQLLKFKRIALEEGVYYGIKKSSGELIKIPLKNDDIKNIQLKDHTMTTIVSIVLPVGFIIITALLLQNALEWGPETNEGI